MKPSPALRALLDSVRETGVSLHPPTGRPYSQPVRFAALLFHRRPVELQQEVTEWADYCDNLIKFGA